MVDKLGLNLSKCSKRVKVVNLGAVAMLGETKIKVSLRTWYGKCMMNVIPLDDFEMVSVMPYLRGILIGDGDHHCFIKANERLNKQGKEASYAERKYNKALERGKCMATLETKSGVVAESVGLVDKMQSSMASSGGPIEF
ncbi:hypothetical protein ACOSQ3_018814 [Xanthoceras sorbifolium]